MKILFVDPAKPFLAPAGIVKLGGTRMSRLSGGGEIGFPNPGMNGRGLFDHRPPFEAQER